jgi:hypothetical protein
MTLKKYILAIKQWTSFNNTVYFYRNKKKNIVFFPRGMQRLFSGYHHTHTIHSTHSCAVCDFNIHLN